jgi:hypothetical protein
MTTIEPSIEVTPAAPLSPAERQRRYRQRNAQRNVHDRNGHNEPNALTVTSRVATRDFGIVLCASQDKIEITFDDDGDAVITQTRWPDEEQTIIISGDNIETFIDRLTDALGIPGVGRP